MLTISDISIDKLRNNKLKKELPEFYELKEVIENNDWHNNDSVFNHTLTVLEKLEELLKNVKDKISNYLNQKITNCTRKDLLFLAALFHDIGKKETMVKKGNWAECPKYEHEKYGSVKVKKILKRIDLSGNEKDIVIQIVRHHGDIHYILDPKNDKLKEQYQDFKANLSNIFLELILLGMADTLGGQLGENKLDEFKFRIDFYNKVIRLAA